MKLREGDSSTWIVLINPVPSETSERFFLPFEQKHEKLDDFCKELSHVIKNFFKFDETKCAGKEASQKFGRDLFTCACDQYNRDRSTHAPITRAQARRIVNERNEVFLNDEKLTHSYF